MGINGLCHNHFTHYIRMEAVVGEGWIHECVGGIIEIWLQIDVIWLGLNIVVYGHQFGVPVRVRRRPEGQHDVGRIDWWQCEHNRPDIVGNALLIYSLKICNNHVS